jgi:hypothetical protein
MANIRGAIVAFAVIRGTSDRQAVATGLGGFAAVSGIDHEVGAAGVVDPDTLTVIAPTEALLAGGIASLPRHRYAASRVHCAVVALSVVGGT